MNYKSFADMIGLSLEDWRSQALLTVLPGTPEIYNPFEQRTYLSYHHLGISILVDNPAKTIWGVFLYANGYDGFDGFDGSLPFDVAFGATVDAVLEKTGAPRKIKRLPKNPNDPIFLEHPFEKQTNLHFQLGDLDCVLILGKEDTLKLVSLALPYGTRL